MHTTRRCPQQHTHKRNRRDENVFLRYGSPTTRRRQTLTVVAMSPFSSTIDGGRRTPSSVAAVSPTATADPRIHRLGCRCCRGLNTWAMPPAPAARAYERRRRGDLPKPPGLGANAAVAEKALTATDLRIGFQPRGPFRGL